MTGSVARQPPTRRERAPRGLSSAAAAWALAVGATVGGCSALVDPGDTPLCAARPGEADPCPDGLSCREGRCRPCDPGGVEVCDNGVDDDCDGLTDEGALDVDGDGYRGCAAAFGAPVDCDDARATARPGGVEACDGRDGDCDGVADDGASCGEALTCVDGRCADPSDCRAPARCPADAVCEAVEEGFACVVGARCTADADCPDAVCDVASGRCVVGASVPAGAPCAWDRECPDGGSCDPVDPLDPGAGRVCGLVCGTDAGCGVDEVCAASADGARRCAPAASLGLVAGPGEGTPCARGAECRSGICEDGACLVRCSANRDCLDRLDAGSCRLAPDARGVVGRCVVAPEGPALGDPCGPDTACSVGACLAPPGVAGRCVALCGDGSDCGPDAACVAQDVTVDRLRLVVPVCRPADPSTSGVGAACTVDGDCETSACVAGRCRAPCSRPTDCPAGLGCRPRVTAVGRAAICLPVVGG